MDPLVDSDSLAPVQSEFHKLLVYSIKLVSHSWHKTMSDDSVFDADRATDAHGNAIPPVFHSPALDFAVIARGAPHARTARMRLPHFTAQTPMFMPVGTQGTIKGLLSEQVESIEPFVILGNTFHLGSRPGPDRVSQLGGLHEMMGWPRAMLTDSGGFQMVSLLDLAQVTEEGVVFESPHDGTKMLLTPEESIRIQNALGADIMMQLDDVIAPTTPSAERMQEAMLRTIRWIDRCIAANSRPNEQNLFAIVQGGVNDDMRRECARELVKRNLPGYAVGGLAGGEDKHDFWRAVAISTAELPFDRPRYCMGVGYPVDLVVCVALGIDMFDCVYPTRTARFGTALTWSGTVNLKHSECASQMGPIDTMCTCQVCKRYSRAYLYTLVGRTDVGCQLLSIHNLSFLMQLMASMRAALEANAFHKFVCEFFARYYPDGKYPQWAVDALQHAGFPLPTTRSQ
jgi:queuine tRNA-ribosyltransferase